MIDSAPLSSDKPTLGQGDITIQLGEETLVLKPTIGAARTISRKYDGFQNCINRLGRLDFDTVVEVLAIGSQTPNTPSAKDALANKVYAAGMTDDTGSLCALCIDYIASLMRGGKPAPTQAELEELAAKQKDGTANPRKP